MKRKQIKYIIAVVVVLFLAYHSVFIKKLDEVRAAQQSGFDAAGFAAAFWQKELVPSLKNAVPLNQLIQELNNEPEKAFNTYGKTLGIGYVRYFMVQGEGIVHKINEDDIELQLANSQPANKVSLETEYVYGNAVRDASGLIQITDFDNTMDLNNVSEQINHKIKIEVVKPFLANVRVNEKVKFIGALELNSKHPQTKKIELIPVQLELVKD